MKPLKVFLAQWLFSGGTIQYVPEMLAIRTHVDALAFFAADTCDVINPLIVRVEALEDKQSAPKTVRAGCASNTND